MYKRQPQHRLRIARRRQHVHEKSIGARIVTDARVDQPRVARRRAHRERVDLQPVPIGQREDLDQTDGILLEECVIGQRKPTTIEHEAFQLARAAAQGRQADKAAPAPGEAVVEMREEQAGEIPHLLRGQEIMLHEAFDRRAARPVGIAHAFGDLALEIEGCLLYTSRCV